MTPSESKEKLHGSLEGTLREPGLARLKGVGRAAGPEEAGPVRPGDGSSETSKSPMVLYGRLGYIRRDQLEGSVHHSPPSES